MELIANLASLLSSLVLIKACEAYAFGEWAEPADDARKLEPLVQTIFLQCS